MDVADPSSDTRAFFETFQLLEAQRPDFDRVQLVSALGAALEKAGHVRLVRATGEQDSSDQLSGLFVPVLFWGLGSSIGISLNTSPLAWLGLGAGVAIAYGVLAAAAPKTAGPVAATLMLTWVAVAVVLGLTDASALVWTHGIPITGAFAVAIALRTLRLREARDVALALAGVARSAPYVAPVVLVAVLLPALTADVWHLAADIEPSNLVGAALLSVGVLLLLVGRQLRRELEPALAARCRSLAARVTAAELTRDALSAAVDGDTARIVHELPAERLVEAWPTSGEEYAPYLVAAEGRALRRPLTARLLITAAVIGLLLAAYIYALLAVTVPTGVAADWARSPIQSHEVSLAGIDLGLPGDVYVAMAVLLGVFATAIFLAFALTEERIAAALTEALLREPIDHFLLLALPFVSLLEWGLENQERLQSADDEDSEVSEEPSEPDNGDVNR